jgi:hypothetical protein
MTLAVSHKPFHSPHWKRLALASICRTLPRRMHSVSSARRTEEICVKLLHRQNLCQTSSQTHTHSSISSLHGSFRTKSLGPDQVAGPRSPCACATCRQPNLHNRMCCPPCWGTCVSNTCAVLSMLLVSYWTCALSYQVLSYYCMRSEATSVSGLKILVCITHSVVHVICLQQIDRICGSCLWIGLMIPDKARARRNMSEYNKMCVGVVKY